MKSRAFTMAELLVTMSIIGVIAAITIPIIRGINPNNEMVMFKKTYFIASRTINELINDEDYYPEADTNVGSGFSHVDLRDVGLPQATYNGRQYSGASKFCGLFASKLNISGDFDPNVNCNGRRSLDAGGNFETTDGVRWSMPFGTFAGGSELILVDVNGNKQNNCGEAPDFGGNVCAAGVEPDRFAIRVFRDGRIEVPSAVARRYLTSQNTNKKYSEILEELRRN